MILTGRSVSPGVFEGRAHLLDASDWIHDASRVAPIQDAEHERERLRAALARARAQLERVTSRLAESGRHGDSQIFGAHAHMMDDPLLLEAIERGLVRGLSAEAAVAEAVALLERELSASTSSMVRDRALDVLDIGHRLVRCLDPESVSPDAPRRATVLVAEALTPSELMHFVHRGPCAAVTRVCGAKSHTAILARSLGVPLVTGIDSPAIAEGDLVLIDARQGLVIVETDEVEGQSEAVALLRQALARAGAPAPTPAQPVTRDGARIRVSLNVSDPLEAAAVPLLGAAGVGLFRTEFIYMDHGRWPSEDEIYAACEAVARQVGSGDLYVRLADFGADKCPEYADLPSGRNPSLGIRGVRLLLQRPDILEPQVRAIARVAERHPLALLVPMVDTVDTLSQVIEKLQRICRVKGTTLPFQLGAMIEVPAAALCIREILERVDLVSVGLNDLTQYLMAADREDELVESYHDALQPAVLRLVASVFEAADVAGRPASVCGELAGDPSLTRALLAIGARRLSVSRLDYPGLVELVTQLSLGDLVELRRSILAAHTADEVRRLLAASEIGSQERDRQPDQP